MSIRIKNWSKHQHFKDRLPPWIKLYREILDDPDWHELDGESAKVLIGLWLIASEDESKTGALPSLKKVAFRLRITEKELKQYLTSLSGWLISDDIDMISTGYRLDAPETETETEVSAYASVSFVPQDDLVRKVAAQSNCPAEAIVDLYHLHMPDNPRCKVLNDARRRNIRARWKEAAKLTVKPFGYDSREDGLKAWGDFFAVCAESAFLTGRSTPMHGKPPFIADIDFLMSPSGFAKTLENKYHRDAA